MHKKMFVLNNKIDLRKTSNLLITGSDYSNYESLMYQIIIDIMNTNPHENKVVLIDSGSDFSIFKNSPFLFYPVAIGHNDGGKILYDLDQEIKRRINEMDYYLMKEYKDRELMGFPELYFIIKDFPYLLSCFDDSEIYLTEIMKLGKRCGVHVILVASDIDELPYYLQREINGIICCQTDDDFLDIKDSQDLNDDEAIIKIDKQQEKINFNIINEDDIRSFAINDANNLKNHKLAIEKKNYVPPFLIIVFNILANIAIFYTSLNVWALFILFLCNSILTYVLVKLCMHCFKSPTEGLIIPLVLYLINPIMVFALFIKAILIIGGS